MTFFKTSLAVSFGVAALCLSAQVGAARTPSEFTTRVNLETDQSSRQSGSTSRLIFAQQTKTTPLNSPVEKKKIIDRAAEPAKKKDPFRDPYPLSHAPASSLANDRDNAR